VSGIDAARLAEMFSAVAEAIEADKERLCRLDGRIGDGDHGIAMALGFSAARDAVEAMDQSTADPAALLNAAARAFLNAVGASCGPLYATAFMRAAAAVKGKTILDAADLAAMLQAMAKGIQDRGKADRGEKTMLDAWGPAADAAAAALASKGGLAAVLSAAAEAALEGAEATIPMLAGKGRASRLGERVRGHMDPGAASAATVITAMRDSLGQDRGSGGSR
jgi:phosphoenolpyruvate---glycerone phosphotransferase subunit DhaL